jgi:hypothetical protein
LKILITGGKSVQALKAVKTFAHDTIILADYGEMPSFPSKTYKFISLGERNDDIIAHNLLNHCLNEAVDAVLPLHLPEITEVAKSSILFEEFGIQVLSPEADQIIQSKQV